MSVIIYHNPNCTKSRQTLALIEARGINHKIVEYLKTPPSMAELDDILKLLKIEPRALMRRNEPEYRLAKLDNPNLTRAALIETMIDYPKLIERPIVLANGRAAIGRPPENVLKIL